MTRLLLVLVANTSPFDRLVDYGALGIFLMATLFALKIMLARYDKQQEKRETQQDKQYEECQRLYHECLKKLDTLQDLRVAEGKQHADSQALLARDAIKVAHQTTATAAQVASWMEKLEEFFQEFRKDVVTSIQSLKLPGAHQDDTDR